MKSCFTPCRRFNIINDMIGWLPKNNRAARSFSTFNNMNGSMNKNSRAARSALTLGKLIRWLVNWGKLKEKKKNL